MNVPKYHFLIVDDDVPYAINLKEALADMGSADVAHSSQQFHAVFKPYKYDLILLDLRLEVDLEGLDLVQHIIEEDPSAIVIVVSGYGDIATAVKALRKGAKNFLEKGKVSVKEIRTYIEFSIKESLAERRIRQLESLQESDDIIGDDPNMNNIKDLIRKAANHGDAKVLIRGETGTGKELVAKAIHKMGLRKEWPFISVALTDNSLETISSELFGHEKGAFTGASRKHSGYFERAHRGVLFIDEIGDLPLGIQLKLLRVLESNTFTRMGGEHEISVDTQIITATNKNIEELVRQGKFREDLYWRIKGVEIHIPPLRERQKDIMLIAEHFLGQLRKKGKTTIKSFSEDAQRIFTSYGWPGNVRELRNVIDSVTIHHELGEKITSEHITKLLHKTHEPSMALDEWDIQRNLADFEMKMANAALKATNGKKIDACTLLKYSNRFTMIKRLKKLISTYPDIALRYPMLNKHYGTDDIVE